MAGKFKSHDIDIHVYEKNIDIQRDIDILNPIHNPYEYIFCTENPETLLLLIYC